jgi:hypothetical protein
MIAECLRKAVIYAGPAVIATFREWRDNLHDDGATPAEVRGSMLRFESLVKGMRRDLGISNWMLQDGDLLRVTLTDFDLVYPAENSEQLQPPEPDEEPRVTASVRSRG